MIHTLSIIIEIWSLDFRSNLIGKLAIGNKKVLPFGWEKTHTTKSNEKNKSPRMTKSILFYYYHFSFLLVQRNAVVRKWNKLLQIRIGLFWWWILMFCTCAIFFSFFIISNERRDGEIFANESNLNNNECVAYDRIKNIYYFICYSNENSTSWNEK